MKATLIRAYWLLFSALVSCQPVVAFAFTVENSEYNFTVQVPEEFEAFDFLAVHSGKTKQFVKKNTLYAFRKDGDPAYMHILIERSAWVMAHNPTPGQNLSELKNAWQGTDINLYRHEDGFFRGKATRVTLNAIIPLKAGPVQFKLSGPPTKEREMESIIESMLESLEAEPDFLSGVRRHAYLLVPLAALGLFIYFVRRR